MIFPVRVVVIKPAAAGRKYERRTGIWIIQVFNHCIAGVSVQPQDIAFTVMASGRAGSVSISADITEVNRTVNLGKIRCAGGQIGIVIYYVNLDGRLTLCTQLVGAESAGAHSHVNSVVHIIRPAPSCRLGRAVKLILCGISVHRLLSKSAIHQRFIINTDQCFMPIVAVVSSSVSRHQITATVIGVGLDAGTELFQVVVT